MEEIIFNLKEGGLIFTPKNTDQKRALRALVFKEWRAQPLDIDSLELFLDKSKKVTFDIKLNIKNSFTFEDGIRKPIKDEYTWPLELDFNFKNRLDIFCIVPGGWLPIGIGMINSKVLGDRNFIDRIRHYFSNNDVKEEYKDNFFSNLDEMMVEIDILPFAMEGNLNNFQDTKQIKQQVEEAKRKVKEVLPNIPIVEYEGIKLDSYVQKLLDYLRPTIELRQNFLEKVQDSLLNPSPKVERIIERWDRIIKVADEVGISRKDIVVVCSLLIVSSPQNDSPIRGVLKPKSNIEKVKIYNVVFDINLIELLLNVTKGFPDKNYVVITHDKDLVRLASLMTNLTHLNSDGNISTFSSSIPIKYIGTDERLHNKLKELLACNK